MFGAVVRRHFESPGPLDEDRPGARASVRSGGRILPGPLVLWAPQNCKISRALDFAGRQATNRVGLLVHAASIREARPAMRRRRIVDGVRAVARGIVVDRPVLPAVLLP